MGHSRKKIHLMAAICFKGKRRCLGNHKKFEDAVKARKRGEEEYYNKFLEEFAAGKMKKRR